MVLAQLLETIGLGGGIVLLAMGVLAVWHVRSGMKAAANVKTWVMTFSAFALLLLAGEAGLVPGLDPELGKLLDFLLGIRWMAWNLGWNVLAGLGL